MNHFYDPINLEVLWVRHAERNKESSQLCGTCTCSRAVHERVFYENREILRGLLEMIRVIASFKENVDVHLLSPGEAYVFINKAQGIARYPLKSLPKETRIIIEDLYEAVGKQSEKVYIITTEGPGMPGIREFVVMPDSETHKKCEAFFRDQ